MTRALLALAVCLPGAALAGDHDLALWRLGHPDPITVCTTCDGSDRAPEAGDAAAQTRFARLASALGLAFAPRFGDAAGTLGQAGFEVGFGTHAALLDLDAKEWATQATRATSSPPGVLLVPSLRVRKGLGASIEVGAAVSTLASSGMVALSGQLRWALVDGYNQLPDLAVRAWVTRVTGAAELDLTTGGGDVLLSRAFGLGGTLVIEPWAQGGVVGVNAATGVVDFRPSTEDPKDPTSDDGVFRTIAFLKNLYVKVGGGLRLRAGALVLGVEGSTAWGSNPVQSGSNTRQTTRQTGLSGQLGFSF